MSMNREVFELLGLNAITTEEAIDLLDCDPELVLAYSEKDLAQVLLEEYPADHYDSLFRFAAWRVVGHCLAHSQEPPADLEDATATVMAMAWRRIKRGGFKAFRYWMARNPMYAIRSTWRQAIRSECRLHKREFMGDKRNRSSVLAHSLEDYNPATMPREVDTSEVWEFISMLPEDLADFAVVRFGEIEVGGDKTTMAETAGILGISERSAYTLQREFNQCRDMYLAVC